MKRYTVEITNEALTDMDQLYNHIAYVLQSPENAINQYNRIADAILTLDTLEENPYCGIGAGTEQRDETAVGR